MGVMWRVFITKVLGQQNLHWNAQKVWCLFQQVSSIRLQVFFHLRNLLVVKKVEICKELSEEKVLLFIGPFFITGGGGLVGGCPSRIRSFRG